MQQVGVFSTELRKHHYFLYSYDDFDEYHKMLYLFAGSEAMFADLGHFSKKSIKVILCNHVCNPHTKCN